MEYDVISSLPEALQSWVKLYFSLYFYTFYTYIPFPDRYREKKAREDLQSEISETRKRIEDTKRRTYEVSL